jgi:hypothetical protein
VEPVALLYQTRRYRLRLTGALGAQDALTAPTHAIGAAIGLHADNREVFLGPSVRDAAVPVVT